MERKRRGETTSSRLSSRKETRFSKIQTYFSLKDNFRKLSTHPSKRGAVWSCPLPRPYLLIILENIILTWIFRTQSLRSIWVQPCTYLALIQMGNFETIKRIRNVLMSRYRKAGTANFRRVLLWKSHRLWSGRVTAGWIYFKFIFLAYWVLPKYWEISFLARCGRPQRCHLFHLSAIWQECSLLT